MLQELTCDAFFSNPDRSVNSPGFGLKASQLLLIELRSLAVGYLLSFPQSRQVINTVVPASLRVLTLQFAPGTRRVPQPLQMKSFSSLRRRTPDFMPIRRASST